MLLRMKIHLENWYVLCYNSLRRYPHSGVGSKKEVGCKSHAEPPL